MCPPLTAQAFAVLRRYRTLASMASGALRTPLQSSQKVVSRLRDQMERNGFSALDPTATPAVAGPRNHRHRCWNLIRLSTQGR